MNPSSKPTTESDKVRVRIYRYDPATDREPRYDSFEVPYRPLMRILDVLDYVHETLEVDVGYRWLCTSKKCGSCAVNVNGSPKLACWDEALPEMVIEPLNNMAVVRDLVTSRDGYEQKLAQISPLLIRKEAYQSFPEPITENDFAPTVHLRDCIQCLACESVCPVVAQPDSGFAGPAVLVALSELAQDPRDAGERGRIADEVANVFKCVSCYECERVCPTEIPIVGEAIEPLKRLAYQQGRGVGSIRARAFLDVVKQEGHVNGALVALRTKGITFGTIRLAARLIGRRKIDLPNILGMLFGRRSKRADAIRRAYQSPEAKQ